MKRFIRKLMLFLLPIVIVILLFCQVAYNSGEIKDIDENIDSQRKNHNVLIGLGYNEDTSYYKLSNANYYKADVIALGTSRVMQFKTTCFNNSFYNCGGAVGGDYNQYINFLKNMDYTPKCILFSADWCFFNGTSNGSGDYTEYKEINKTQRSKSKIIKSIISDFAHGKWTLRDLYNYPNNIGYNGRVKGAGYMYDGSYYYGNIYREPEKQNDYLFKNTLYRISNGVNKFEWGEHIDSNIIVQLDDFLSYCSENGIYAIGIAGPFAPTVYGAMMDSGKYGYIAEIEPACKELCDKYNFEFYNYMDPSVLNLTDYYFIDGFHGSEVSYAYILKDMVSRGSIISDYVDINKIDLLIENAYDGRTFYNPF